MSTKYVSPGKVMPYVAAGTLAAGAVVVIGEKIGVVLEDAETGDVVSLGMSGVYELTKKAALAIDQGDIVYWDASPGEITKTDGDGVRAGYAWKAAATSDATVQVKLFEDRSA